MSKTPQSIDWNNRTLSEVRPGIFGATVHTPQLTVVYYRYEPGSEWETHSHPQDQVTTVLAGEIDFIVDGRPVHLTAGQTATLPGHVSHSATTPAAGAVTINVFTLREQAPVV